MTNINDSYGRDLDLNLLRVFAVVAQEENLTRAAARLYVTQPAISAAMARLTRFIGSEVITRQGGKMVLTKRGRELLSATRAHLRPLIGAATSAEQFDPLEAFATLRLGLADGLEFGLLPRLLTRFAERAPNLQLIVRSVQFRNVVGFLLEGKVDVAVAVPDVLPRSIQRRAVKPPAKGRRGFVCLFDGATHRLPDPVSEREYFAQDHVIVSYAGDTRGIVEDMSDKQRRVRVSVPAFGFLPALLLGSKLVATVPWVVARPLIAAHPRLEAVGLPLKFPPGEGLEILWSGVTDTDPAAAFLRSTLIELLETPDDRRTAEPRGGKRKRR